MPVKETVRYHLRSNLFQYLFLSVLFLLGIISGTYVVMRYDMNEVKDVTVFMEDFFKIFSQGSVDSQAIFKTSVLHMTKEFLMIWLLGFTVIGVLGIVLLVFRRGFLIGFVSAFLIKVYTAKGIGISLILFSAQAVLYIPVLFVLSVFGFEFSLLLVHMVTGKIKYKTDIKKFILFYTCVMVCAVLIGCVYALSETYIVPYLLKAVM